MKKILFSTSALIAAGLISNNANAAGIELDVSGYVNTGIAIVSVESINPSGGDSSNAFGSFNPGTLRKDLDTIIINDGEIHFNASGTLDNGLTLGAKAELEAWGENGTTIDEAYVYGEGSFGRIEIGEADGAHDWGHNGNGSYGCTSFQCAYDGDGINFDKKRESYFNFSDTSIDGADTSDDLKISYYTPTFSGFAAGVSYVPSTNDNGITSNTNQQEWAYEIGARYNNSFGDFDVNVGAGYTDQPELNDAARWAVGLGLGYAGFGITGVYEEDLGDANVTCPTGTAQVTVNGQVGCGTAASTDDVTTTTGTTVTVNTPAAITQNYLSAGYGTEGNKGIGLGISYETGPWDFGLTYALAQAGVGTSRSYAANGLATEITQEKESQSYGFGVDYELGSGVEIGGILEYVTNNLGDFRQDSRDAATGVVTRGNQADESGFGGGLFMNLSF